MFFPLEGVRILDLTRLLPGPYCTWVLSSLGAEVLRVEDPGAGDWTRMVPPLMGRHGALFHLLNRGKRSIQLDLRCEAGREVFHDLAARHDVLVEGFRPGTLARLGVSPGSLQAAHPALVGCSISGYGQTGPRANRAGHDLNYQALAGVLWLGGEPDGPPGMPGLPMADLAGGAMHAALGICAALVQRARTGAGCWIDISMTEAAAGLAAPVEAMRGFAAEPDRGRWMLGGALACYGLYRTRDGEHLAMAALEPKFWAQVCDAVGHPEWAVIPPVPGPDQARVKAELAEIIGGRTRAEWEAVFGSIDACVEPVLSPTEASRDSHAQQRGVVEQHGEVRWCRPALGRGTTGDSPAPGEHSDAVLSEIGYSGERIQTLRDEGVLR